MKNVLRTDFRLRRRLVYYKISGEGNAEIENVLSHFYSTIITFAALK